jgi:uroporphyrinogen III methyltransferase/synthase
MTMDEQRGHVWIVGAGPGDPGLITVAGAAALAGAEVVLYDALAPAAQLDTVPAAAERVYVGKRAGNHAMRQEEINAALVEHGAAGRRVVRLKGGDPFVFGRGSEEAMALRVAGVPYSVVPGITSAIGALAYAGIPVTHRGLASNFLVLTGSDARDADGGGIDWGFAAQADSLVILMGAASLARNMAALVAHGKSAETPAACVEWGTTPRQRVARGTVGTIAGRVATLGMDAPMVTIVGPVAALAEEIAWRPRGPLSGRAIAITRARTQASELRAKLEALGADVIETPVIAVRPHPENLPIAERVDSRWDWVVFTSVNGVAVFFDALAALGKDARALHTTQVAAVGSATAEALLGRGVRADFVPSKATSAALAEEIPRVRGARIFLPVAALTGGAFAEALRGRGGLVEQVATYETLAEPLDEAQVARVLAADAITFTSASTARNLGDALGATALPAHAKLISIGPETSTAVRERFGRVDAEAATPGLDALVQATIEALPWD